MKKLSMDELGRISPEEFKKNEKLPLIIILDNIRSMNNIGSIFRTSDAFAVSKLYLCGITATPPQKEIAKTALGATESVDWEYRESAELLIQELKNAGWKVYAVEQTDSSIMLDQFIVNKEDKIVLILGNEVFGVDDILLPLCDGAIEIPQFGTKHSLNVTNAGAIVTWEIVRQHIQNQQ